VFSVGGGAIEVDGESLSYPEAYPLNSFEEIKEYCKKRNLRLWQYAIECEGKEILDYAKEMWSVMKKCIHEGLESEGILPGGLGVVRRAKQLWQDPYMRESAQSKEDRKVAAFAFAVGEQNASGGEIVTAPTCGACGVLPAVFYYHQRKHHFSDETIAKGLLTAGIIGNLVKTNASISGAECGCQAEIGTACAMAAAGLAELLKMSVEEIEYSAEISLEHHLGLTCDPICGLVQIPCIERNAVAAMRAINAVSLASFLTETRKITLDEVIHTMYETGKDLSVNYRETARGGLAKLKKE
ncbi:MAG: L-serine ammonia-lyase, iron-sulfur-dependent, subunit alpha, partial [Clostridia bacterium]|nr:L-serine ammonia-lyase, iron-sulfur-dependent, subunit alpha [Clostridia bacterium]